MAKVQAIPMPQIFARALGRIKFICPNCGQEHPSHPIRWRRLDFQCQRCHVKFQLGLGFSYSKGATAYLMGKWDGFTSNRYNPIGTFYDGAFIWGSVEWQCRVCSYAQQTQLGANNRLECEQCAQPYFISLLIYRLHKGNKSKAPMDSIVKGLNEIKTIQPIPAETPSEGAGINSRIPEDSR